MAQSSKYVLGVDAGGTGTKVLFGSHALIKQKQEIALPQLSQATFAPGNYFQIGVTGAQALIVSIMQYFKLTSLKDVSCIAGFAGGSGRQARRELSGILETLGARKDRTIVVSDAGMLLHAFGGPGIALIAGTGSICVGTNKKATNDIDDKMFRAGGHGYLFADEGSGYYIGKRAINEALQIEDGIYSSQSSIVQKLKEFYKKEKIIDISYYLYNLKEQDTGAYKAKVADFAKEVGELALNDDPIAKKIMKESSDALSGYVRAVANRMGLTNPRVGLHGGIFKQNDSQILITGPMQQILAAAGIRPKFFPLGLGTNSPADVHPLLAALRNNFSTQL